MRCNSKYAIIDIGDDRNVFVLKRGLLRRNHSGRPLFYIVDQKYLNREEEEARLRRLEQRERENQEARDGRSEFIVPS